MLAGSMQPSGSGVGSGSLFESTAWHLFQNLTILLAVAFWIATVWWVLRDARRRIADPWIVVCATMLGLVPFIGGLLYLLVRPLEPLADVRERELEMRALKRRLASGTYCPACGGETESSFRFCPACAAEIRRECVGCKTALDLLWRVCPYCGTPADAMEPEPEAAPTLVEVLAPTPATQSASQ